MEVIVISTQDYYAITATLFGESNSGPVVLINSGTGKLNHSTIDAAKLPARALGHFGFFREQNQDVLWKPLLAFLNGTDANPFSVYATTN